MRRPPPLKSAASFPVVSFTGALAVCVSVAKFLGRDVSALVLDVRAFHGEPWRLLSTVFPHGDVLHLLFNLSWHWHFGTVIERRYGSLRTVLLFVLFGVGASLVQYAFNTGAIGLSGVGYGMFALLWVARRRDESLRDALDTTTVRAFVLWFFVCVALSALGLWNVGNGAHAGGALFGALAALVLTRRGPARVLALGATALALSLGVAASTALRPYTARFSRDAALDSVRLAGLAVDANRPHEALRWAREATRVSPNSARAVLIEGVALLAAGRLDEGVRVIERAQQLDPGLVAVRRALGAARGMQGAQLLAQNANEHAIEVLGRALAADSTQGEAQHNLGVALFRLGRYAEALEAFERALALRQDRDAVLVAMAAAVVRRSEQLEEQGALVEASAVVRRAVARDPNNAGLALREVALAMLQDDRAVLEAAINRAARLEIDDAAQRAWLDDVRARMASGAHAVAAP